MCVGELGEGLQVDDAKKGVGGRFHPQGRRFGPHGVGKGVAVRKVFVGDGEFVLIVETRKEALGAPVAVVRTDQVRTGVEERRDGRHGGHAGGARHGAGPAVEVGQRVLQGRPRRVAATGVVVPFRLADIFKLEDGRLVEGGHDAIERVVEVLARQGENGFRVQVHKKSRLGE